MDMKLETDVTDNATNQQKIIPRFQNPCEV